MANGADKEAQNYILEGSEGTNNIFSETRLLQLENELLKKKARVSVPKTKSDNEDKVKFDSRKYKAIARKRKISNIITKLSSKKLVVPSKSKLIEMWLRNELSVKQRVTAYAKNTRDKDHSYKRSRKYDALGNLIPRMKE